MTKQLRLGAALALALLVATGAQAGEVRRLAVIPSPKAGAAPANVAQVSPQIADQAIRKAMQSWNGASFAAHLGEDFRDRERLVDSVARLVPRDAKLKVTRVGAIRTLARQTLATPDGPREVATVAADVVYEVEFSDPRTGYRRLPGRSEVQVRLPLASH